MESDKDVESCSNLCAKRFLLETRRRQAPSLHNREGEGETFSIIGKDYIRYSGIAWIKEAAQPEANMILAQVHCNRSSRFSRCRNIRYFSPRFFFSMTTCISSGCEQIGQTYRCVVSLRSGSRICLQLGQRTRSGLSESGFAIDVFPDNSALFVRSNLQESNHRSNDGMIQTC